MKIVTQYKGREEENKKYAITHRLLLDLVAICLVFFFSSLFFSYPIANVNNISFDGVTQKRKEEG